MFVENSNDTLTVSLECFMTFFVINIYLYLYSKIYYRFNSFIQNIH